MKKLLIPLLLLLIVLTLSFSAEARILLPLTEEMEITEGEARVGLLWNGEEHITVEKLILESSTPGKLLAIMPMSSATTHTYQNETVMQKARENFLERRRSMTLPDYFTQPLLEYPEIELLGEELLEVTEPEELEDSLTEFLQAADLEDFELNQERLDYARDYAARGYNWLSLQLLEIGESPAVRIDSWRFVSRQLFYPLQTGNNFDFKFTAMISDPLPEFITYGWDEFDFYIPPQITPPPKVSEIHPRLGEFYPGVMVHTHYWELSPPPEGFTEDLQVRGEDIRDLIRRVRGSQQRR